MAHFATDRNLDLFANSSAAVVAINCKHLVDSQADAGEELFDAAQPVASIFHFAADPKGINDYPESYESLRMRCSKKEIETLLIEVVAA